MVARSKRANRGKNYALWAAEGLTDEQTHKKRKTDAHNEEGVRCSCGATTYNEADTRPMVECENCLLWQHIACETNGGDESQLGDPYYCFMCKGSSKEQGDAEYQQQDEDDEEIAAIEEVEEEEPLDKVRQSVITALDANFTKQLIPMAQRENLLPADLDAASYSLSLAKEIELALFNAHGDKGSDVGAKYRERFRTLSFNLKNNKNHHLQTQIITRQVSPEALAVLSADEMLSPELRKLADQVKQESIQGSILKVDEGPRVRKTHKGEELVENENQEQQPQPPAEQSQQPEPAEPTESTSGARGHAVVTEAQYDNVDNYEEPDFSPMSPRSSDDEDDDFAATMGNTDIIENPVWEGNFSLKDVADISLKAFHLGGNSPSWTSKDWSRVVPASSRTQLQGRVAAHVALPYINRMSAIRVVAALALTSGNTKEYDSLFQHYNSRGKYGVIKDHSALAKDAYLIPLTRESPIPEALNTVKETIDQHRDSNGNLLIALYVLPNSDLLG